jgi:hypothetical protein
MSSIFSDPYFRRGNTLLAGEPIETDAAGNPVAGSAVVGAVKVFQDVNPYDGTRYSNRLVYCVAARYEGNTVEDGSTVAGTLYAFDAARPMTEFTNAATKTNVSDGRAVGVLDEYLTGRLRKDDVVWVVVKGPTTVKKEAGAALGAGASVVVSNTAGSAAAAGTANAGTVQIGEQIAGAEVASATTAARVNLFSNRI